jgi:hypothetical protein
MALTLEQFGAKNDFTTAQAAFDTFLRDIERFQAELDRRARG